MSNQIEQYNPMTALEEKKGWSLAMADGDLLPQQYRRKPANLLFAAEYADALGISRIHVLTSIAVINGRPSPSADLMSAMVRARGHKLRVVGDDTYAEATLIRADDPDFEYKARWDQAKAVKAGLWGNKGPWTLYPAAMLRSRAISEVVRMGATDVMAGGIYTPEELGAQVDAEGNMTESPRHAQATRTAPAPQSVPEQVMTELAATPVDGLTVDEWAEKIVNATTLDDLMHMYPEASTNPEWDTAIKPLFTTRKEQIEQDAQEPVEAELMPESA